MKHPLPDSIASFINWYSKNNIDLGYKAGLVLLLIFLALVVDNLSGFTFFYQNKQRLEQVEQIRQLKLKSGLDSIQVVNLTELQNTILSRKDMRYYIYGFLGSSLTNRTTMNDIIKNNITSAIIIKKNVSVNKLNHVLSSSYILVIILVMLPFMSLMGISGDVASNFVFLFFNIIGLTFVIAFNAYIMWLIIPLFKYAWTQHFFNFSAHTLVFSLLVKLINDKKIDKIEAKNENLTVE